MTKFTAGAGGVSLRGSLALDRDRYETTVLTAPGGSLAAEAVGAGVPVITLRHLAPDLRPGSDLRGVTELAELLAAGRYDVVHTHSAKAGAIGRLAARRAGTAAVVHTLHGFPFHPFQSRARRAAYLAAERRLAALTDHFMASGSEVAAEAVRLRIAPPERIRAIPTIPVGTGFRPASAQARRRARAALGVPAGAPLIGTVARLDAQKAPLDMVRAMAALGRDDVYLAWAGDGELRARTRRLADRHGLADRFLLLGERSDVPELLPAFDVFALSSLYEGLPCSLLEAMSCEVPVVATAVNAVPEIVISGRTGLLARANDPGSLAGALRHLLDHPAEGARMAAAARAHIAGRFDDAALARDCAEVYELALARTGRSAP